MPKNEDQEALCKVSSPIGVRITLWCLSFAGFVLSSLAVSSCRFIKVASITQGGIVGISFTGIYRFQSRGICVSSSVLSSLPRIEGTSSSLKAARAFGVLAPLAGGVATLWVLISIIFTGTSKPLWITMASLLVASTAFQLFTFIAFNDESCKDDIENQAFVDCFIEEGSSFAISACLFYVLACIGMFIVSPPRTPLIRFEEGWRGGPAEGGSEANTGNNKTTVQSTAPQQQDSPVLALHEEQAKPIVSSTSPPIGSFPDNDNLLHAGASISPVGSDDEESGSPFLKGSEVKDLNRVDL